VYGDYDPGTGGSTSGTRSVQNNVIDRYQKGGIIISEAGSNAAIRDNTILGVGETPQIAQNGIQVSYGGRATVRLNSIRDNSYTDGQDDVYDAGGIILFRPNADTLVGSNTVTRNDYNIGLFNADGLEIRSNRATNGKDLAGIFVNAKSTDNLFTNNRALGNERFDCLDHSEGTGTAGTANTWTDDIGETDRPSGICRPP
jgi:nitrous oxidase accessory protein NosD